MTYFITYILPVILLISGFIALIKGASLFVDFSSSFAKRLGVSQLFIALTIVAMGTSIPETAVSLSAAIKGNAELSIGNIVGTNTLNILLILGITSLIAPLTARKTTVRFEIPIMIFTAIIFPLLGLGFSLFSQNPIENGSFSRIDGVLFLLLFFMYLCYLSWLAKKSKTENALMVIENKISWISLIFFIYFGLGLIILGSSFVVRGATQIATNLGVSERIIGLTIVAFGTSLPELSTSIVAAIKKQDDLAIGNIVGSNIYNMLFIGGLTAVICPVSFSSTFQFDSLVCIITSLLLLLLVLNKRNRLSRTSGIIMLILYSAYTWFLLR